MRIAILLISLLAAVAASSFSQEIAGTWHGFQISRDKGKRVEYRIIMDFKVLDENVTGTMQVKSPLKGVIMSSFSGTYDRRQNMVYLREDAILTEGVGVGDATLCRYTLRVGKNSLRGTGRSRTRGYDNLELRLQREEVY